MTYILNCCNLIGDSLYCLRPVLEFAKENNVVAIVADKGLPLELFSKQFVDIPVYVNAEFTQEDYPDALALRLSAGPAAELAYKEVQEGKPQMHMTDAYAKMLGIQLETLTAASAPPTDWQNKKSLSKTHIAISPFSRSCSKHTSGIANKTIADEKWENLIRYLRKQELPVKVIAGPNDRLKNVSVPDDDYFTAESLEQLEDFLLQSALVVSVDNGIAHLASNCNVKTIVLWPKISNKYLIGPLFSSKTALIEMEPNIATPAQLLHGLRHFTKGLLNLPDESESTKLT